MADDASCRALLFIVFKAKLLSNVAFNVTVVICL